MKPAKGSLDFLARFSGFSGKSLDETTGEVLAGTLSPKGSSLKFTLCD
jgi:hypothetical protein